jgi:hypothetical protein
MGNQFTDMFSSIFTQRSGNASTIVTDDLTPQMTADQIVGLKSMVNGAMSYDERQALAVLMKNIQITIRQKRDLIKKINNVEDSDILLTALDVVIDDGFNSFINEKELTVQYNSPSKGGEIKKIQAAIDATVSRLELRHLMGNIVEDLLKYGEYFLRIETGTKGITKIIDDLDIENNIAFYDGTTFQYALQEQGSAYNKKYVTLEPSQVLHFCLSFKKIRLETGKIKSTKIPRFIRVGRPLVYPALEIIERVRLMEMASVAVSLKNALKPSIVQVAIPSNSTAEESKQIARNYEKYLNDIHKEITNLNDFSLSSLMAVASRIKPIPVGQDQKGGISQVDIGNQGSAQDTRDSIEAIRKMAALAIGIPTYYLVSSDSPQNKGEMLKMYSRYTRKLVTIQNSLALGVRELIYQDLLAQGIVVTKDFIEPKFRTLINGDTLDDVEMLVATVTALGELYTTLDTIAMSEQTDLIIDTKKFEKFFNSYISQFVSLQGVLKVGTTPDSTQTEVPGDVEKPPVNQVTKYVNRSMAKQLAADEKPKGI